MTGAGFGLYVHWPWCARICPYCDFNVYRAPRGARSADVGAMARAIARAVAQWAEVMEQDGRASAGPLTSIHFGGGTPSLMPPEAVAEVVAAARAAFGLADDAEIGMEANPEDADPDAWAAFRRAGVERLSLGVQALDDESLTALGRMHTAGQAREAIALAADVFPRASADLISARPGQSTADWEAELDAALSLGLDHLSVYQLTIEPGTAFERAAARGALTPAEEDTAAEIYEITQAMTAAAGLPGYEVSNHARGPAAQSRHNLVYWRSGDWIAAGPGAHARIWGAAGTRRAYAGAARPDAYVAAVEAGAPAEPTETLTPGDAAAEMILMGLRLTEGLDLEALTARTGFSPAPDAVERLAADGLLTAEADRLTATPRGRLVLDRLAAELAP